MSDLKQSANLYTTGEIAKLCGVSVRTVQYYDSRDILVPSELSEGGRRLYSEDDLKRMHIICFLREAGFSINNIGELFADEHPKKVLEVLLEQQEKMVRDEMLEQQLSEIVGAAVGIVEVVILPTVQVVKECRQTYGRMVESFCDTHLEVHWHAFVLLFKGFYLSAKVLACN